MGKIIFMVFWDAEGLVFVICEDQQTINCAYYTDIKVKLAVMRKRLHKGIILLHNNVHPHTVQLTHKTINKLFWETLPHAPYSGDFIRFPLVWSTKGGIT